jgi:hypothetical protein
LASGTPILPLKLHDRSGTVIEYVPLTSTVTVMLFAPTIEMALKAGTAMRKAKTAKTLVERTKGNL